MNKQETIVAAQAVGVVRTEQQFEVMTKSEIADLTADFEKMSDEEKAANNASAEVDEEAIEKEAAKKAAEEEAAKGAEKKSDKSVDEKLKKDLSSVFESYPTIDKAYSTTDGTVFLAINPAENHQIHLTGKKEQVKTHLRQG